MIIGESHLGFELKIPLFSKLLVDLIRRIKVLSSTSKYAQLFTKLIQ